MKKFFLLSFFFSCICFNTQSQVKALKEEAFTIGKSIEMYSEILQEKRTIHVYLPQGYETNDSTQFSVIYLLDGSRDEDFIHISGLVQFSNYPWIQTLAPSIVIGIENVDRKRDFTFPTSIAKDKEDFPTTGSSEKFIRFIESELQNFVKNNFKVNEDKMLIGQSLGGLLATEILFKKPKLFNRYVIISPSLWWDNESLLKLIPACMSPDFKQKTQIYIGVGKEGKIMERDAKNLYKLLQKGKSNYLDLNFAYFGDKDHANILHLAVLKAFEAFKN